MRVLGLSLGLAFLLTGVSEAKLDQNSIAEIFAQGQEPSLAQGQIKWKCIQSTDGDDTSQNCASNYGFRSDGQNFKVPEFVTAENRRTAFEKKSNALVFTQSDKDGTKSHLSIRSIVTAAGPRLVMEESSTLPSWQVPGKKSSITGFTPHVYVICAPEAEFNSFITGKTSANFSNPTGPTKTRR